MTHRIGFEGQGLKLGSELERHDLIHEALDRLPEDANVAEVNPALHTALHENVTGLADMLGLIGIRGLLHVAHEALDELCHQGLRLQPDGEFEDPDEGEAFVAMLADCRAIELVLQVTALFEGKIPADKSLIEAKLAERYRSQEMPLHN